MQCPGSMCIEQLIANAGCPLILSMAAIERAGARLPERVSQPPAVHVLLVQGCISS